MPNLTRAAHEDVEPHGKMFDVDIKNPDGLHLEQLAHELASAHGWTYCCDLNWIFGDDIEYSKLLVVHPQADANTIIDVGSKHTPKPGWTCQDQKRCGLHVHPTGRQ